MSRGANSVWTLCKSIAVKIGNLQLRIIIAVLYFVVLLPFSMLSKLGENPLRTGGWRPREQTKHDPRENALRQS